MTIAQHLSKSNEWYTPQPIVDAARSLMGGIDLDPASCLKANETVRAGMIFDVADDGLTKPWHGKVFLNPPGGKLHFGTGDVNNGKWVPVKDGPGESSMRIWWQRLADHYESGAVEQAFFVAFTLEILRTSQQGIPVQNYFRCYPGERIKFGGAPSPTHANVLVWLPPKSTMFIKHDRSSLFRKFATLFRDIGLCEAGGNLIA